MIKTKTNKAERRQALISDIQDLWAKHYVKGETQITPVAESIAKLKKVSLSTVKRIVKPLIAAS